MSQATTAGAADRMTREQLMKANEVLERAERGETNPFLPFDAPGQQWIDSVLKAYTEGIDREITGMLEQRPGREQGAR